MKKISKLLALLLALVMIFSVLAACSSSDDKDTGTKNNTQTDANNPADSGSQDGAAADGEKDYTLKIGMMQANNTHDPWADGQSNRTQMQTIFERLLNQNPETGELEPWLAESYEYTDDSTLRVKLRDNVYFTDGQKMTANDVLLSYRDYWAAGRMSSYFEAYDWDATEIVDDLTIDFKFTMEFGPAVTMMGAWGIFCAEDMFGDTAASADKWMTAPNGTGPYYCVENVASAYAVYERKSADQYWGELPECTKVTYQYYSESSTMYIDFESGAIDAACALGVMDAQRVLDGDCPSFTGYYLNPINDVMMLILPDEVELFDDVRVRQAMMMAVDRENCALAQYGPLYMPADSIIPSTVNYYEAQEYPAYDPEGAKALLAEAGYPDGITLNYIVTMDQQDLQEAIQASMAAAGITLNCESYDPGTAIPMFRDGKTDILTKQAEGGAYINEPALLLDTLGPTSTLPPAGMVAPEWAEAFEEALYSTDTNMRADGYSKLQKWAAEEYRILPICERANMTVYNTDKLASFVLACADEPCAQYAKFN